MNIALITGIYGQDAYYLTEILLSKKYIIYGITNNNTKNIKNVNILDCDITNENDIINIIKLIFNNHDVNVLEIYNLAAQSNSVVSYEFPKFTHEINGLAVVNFLSAILKLNFNNKIRFFQASSSELYGNNGINPKNENMLFSPISPYGISKLYAHNMVNFYRNNHNIFACCGILFNHESPKRKDTFVTKKITNCIKNNQELVVGNIYTTRD